MIISEQYHFASKRILERCEILAKISSIDGGISRAFLTPQHAEVNAQVVQWMEAAGLNSWQDAIGNQWGRYEGSSVDAPTLIIGSHLDTVPNAGRYDGILGVLLAIELVSELHQQKKRLPFAIEVVGFGDEEGVRFGTAMMGSKTVAGLWQDSWLDLTDDNEQSLREALIEFGLNPEQTTKACRANDNLLGFWEAHIEQGPVLEAEDLPVGIVTGIAGARRSTIRLTGRTGHSGTTPMRLRRDALAGAAEITLAIEKIAKSVGGDVVATVGQIFARPGAVNVIAGDAIVSLDLRSQSDNTREKVLEAINDAVETIAARRHLTMLWTHNHKAKAVLCDQFFQQLFSQSIAQTSQSFLPIKFLPSGAGHDAMAMAEICPTAMLFIRSPGGISHHPDEGVVPEDVAFALGVLSRSLNLLVENF